MATSHTYNEWHIVPDSYKEIAHGAKVAEPTSPDEEFDVTVRLRRKNPLPGRPIPGKRLRREDYANKYSAAADDLERIRAFAQHFHLSILAESAVERIVTLSGKAADFQKAFQVELRTHRFDSGKHYRGRVGPIKVPAEISKAVTGVFGLDNRTMFWNTFRVGRVRDEAAAAGSTQKPGTTVSYYANQLAKIYNFPTGVDGTGQNIGIVELGGGFTDTDLKTFYQKAGLTRVPKYTARPVKGGGTNSPPQPGKPTDAAIEVMLDMEVAGTIAPGAEMFMYFVKEGTDQQILLGISAAVHDQQADLSVMSLSFGGAEYDVVTMGGEPGGKQAGQIQTNIDDLFQSAGHLGITVCVATGDQASSGWPQGPQAPPWDGKAHADFPASSPNVLACGGTHIVTPTPGKPSEEVWHPAKNEGSGGGVSRFFPQPDYQKGIVTQTAKNPNGGLGRAIPDVCADAANESGYNVLCAGVWFNDSQKLPGPIGGTSAATPLWAGLIALINQSLDTRVGFINPLLYKIGSPSSAFFDVVKGTNDDYSAGPGWDACTGLGSPNGMQLLNSLKPLLPAGDV
jgi:kumamolisin